MYLRANGVNDLNAVSTVGNRTLFVDLTSRAFIEEKVQILEDAMKDPSKVDVNIPQ
jgi:hypothetical protein